VATRGYGLGAKLGPRDALHLEVGENDVDVVGGRLEELQRVLGRLRQRHAVVALRQVRFENRTEIGIVVDHQDMFSHSASPAPPRGHAKVAQRSRGDVLAVASLVPLARTPKAPRETPKAPREQGVSGVASLCALASSMAHLDQGCHTRGTVVFPSLPPFLLQGASGR